VEDSKINIQPKLVMYAVLAFVMVCVLSLGGIAGCKSFNRYQKRADANNNVKVTQINIRKAEQEAEIVHAQNATVQAKAEQRVIEAEGIRQAQDKISATLTPLYIQHEAIKAQENDRAGDRTYIPVGPQGVPLVANIDDNKVK
jgi:hypothetical protein